MNGLPQVVPVSELRNKHREVFRLLGKGPVILAQRSKAAAVLVSVEEWDRRARRLVELEREIIRQRLHANRQEPDVSYDDFMTGLRERDAEHARAVAD